MTEEKKKPTARELADFCALTADDRKAADIITLDLSELSAVAEYFVICTGTSSPHLRSIAERIQRDALEKFGLKARVDGSPDSHWMITDFGSVMVHVFTEETRKLYQLENLWGDAPKVESIRKLEQRVLSSRLK